MVARDYFAGTNTASIDTVKVVPVSGRTASAADFTSATVRSPVPWQRRNTVSVVPATKAEPSAVPRPPIVNALSPEPLEPWAVVI
jgi:hypothetical protein